MVIESGQLKGSFKGFKNRDTVFEFLFGGTWKQDEYQYQYFYASQPNAKVFEDNGRYYIEVEGMGAKVEVKKVR